MTTSTNIKPRRSECPISFGLDLFGDKWTLLILRDILLFNKTRFSDFAVPEKIATNVLADRLNRLEVAGVITKTRDKVLKNQNIYQLTHKGRDLSPTLVSLMLWGLQYDKQTPVSREFIRRIAGEYEQVVKEISEAIKHERFEEYRAAEMGVDASLYKYDSLASSSNT